MVSRSLLFSMALVAFMASVSFAQDNAPIVPCNCAGCWNPNLVQGSSGWCTCCRSAVEGDDCQATCNRQLYPREFIFEAEGCINADWKSKCDSTSAPSTETTTAPSTETTTPPPTQTTESQETTSIQTDPTSPTLPSCNCASCSRPGHFPGSTTWCRCCAAAYNECECERGNVYEWEGCLSSGFDDKCPDIGLYIGEIGSTSDDIAASGSSDSSSTATTVIIVLLVVLILMVCVSMLFIISRQEQLFAAPQQQQAAPPSPVSVRTSSRRTASKRVERA